MTEETKAPEAAKRNKKLLKDLSKSPIVAITAEGGEKGAMQFDFTKLPQIVKDKLGPFGLGHKLGDSAAGRTGKDAEEAIQKVWDGLMSGDWSVRAPAAPKVSLSDIASNFEKLSNPEKAKASALLAALGIKLPGVK